MGWMSDLFGGGSGGASTDWTGIVSSGLNLYSQYEEGQARSDAYSTKASNTRSNAAYEMQRARDADVRGSEAADKYALSAERYKGKQIAGQGASGFVVGSGSFQDVNRETDTTFQSDLQTIMRNTMREAYGHKLAADSGIQAANDYDNAAYTSWLNTQLGLAGSIITGDLAEGLSKKYWE